MFSGVMSGVGQRVKLLTGLEANQKAQELYWLMY